MKRILILVLGICLASSSAFAQTANEEISRLKEHLELPAKAAISGQAAGIPQKDPIKVFVAVGLDSQTKANFVRWINRWNKSNTKKYPKMELVSEIAQADVVLARFMDRDSPATQYGGASSRRYSNQFDVGVILGLPYPYPSHPVTVVPVYAYVLVAQGKEWAISYRYIDTTSLRQGRSAGKYLWDQFQKMVKDSRKK